MALPPRAPKPAPGGRSQVGVVGLTLLAAFVLAGGCGREPEKPLVIAFGDSPVTLDPHTSNRNVAWSVLASFYDPLVSLGPNLRPLPALATSWEHTSPTRWRFHLRSGVTFCTGEPLTAGDVVASFERARTLPTSAVAQYLVGVRSITAAGPATVVIETDGTQADLLNRLSFIFVVRARDAGPGFITAPVGTGAYRFAGERTDGTILADRWGGWHGRPACGRVVFEFAGNGEAAVGRLLAGAADVCHLVPDAWLA